MSDRLDPPTFPTLSKDITLVMRLLCKSLAIGLPASRVGVRKDGSCPSVSDRLDPPTFPALCKDITLVMRLFSKGWFPYDRRRSRIADRRSQIAESSAIVCDHMETHFCDRLRSCDRDRRRSQTIAEDRTMFYLLRSFAILRSYGNQSSAICDRNVPHNIFNSDR